jgi:hypothetical protein
MKKPALKTGARVYGYARVSTTVQDLTIQQAALEAAGCLAVFAGKKSGTFVQSIADLSSRRRPADELDRCLLGTGFANARLIGAGALVLTLMVYSHFYFVAFLFVIGTIEIFWEQKKIARGEIATNYRRGDDPGFTTALYQNLELEFGADQLFKDVEGHIKPGDDF